MTEMTENTPEAIISAVDFFYEEGNIELIPSERREEVALYLSEQLEGVAKLLFMVVPIQEHTHEDAFMHFDPLEKQLLANPNTFVGPYTPKRESGERYIISPHARGIWQRIETREE